MFFLKAFIFIIVLLILLFWSVKRDKNGDWKTFEINRKRLKNSIITIILLAIFLPSVGTIPAGSRGVVLRFSGVTGRILNEGIYIVTPIAERAILADVRINAYEVEATSASKDLQEVSTKVTLNYSLDPEKVAEIYQKIGTLYLNRIVKPSIQEAVKASTALFEAEKLIVERPLVKETIEMALKERLRQHGILVDAISITDFAFSKEFTQAIESKVTATQLAMKAERDLGRVKMEAQQKIEQAKGDAEALRLQREQVTPLLLQKLAIEKWDGVLPQVMSGDGAVPFININGKGK